MNKLHIIKRDGSHEPFDPEKIQQVVIAAGLTKQQANKLAQTLTAWTNKQLTATLTSLQIRDKVLVELKSIHPPAANMFAWYQKTKE